MRYDTIIIGGGLSGLVCGIKLQEAGRSCAIISAGQSALHFSSGAFDLLGVTADGTEVERPFDALKSLPAEHPYSKVGADGVEAYARALPQWFAQMGIVLNGDVERNSSRITPLGIVRKSWMMLDEYTPLADEAAIAGSRYLIVNFAGFLDFYPKFIADCLEQRGGKCRIEVLSMSAVEKLRINPTEMRSANIAKVFQSQRQLDKLVELVNSKASEGETVVLPATFGLSDTLPVEYLRSHCRNNLMFVSPVPPSISGIRVQRRLQAHFVKLGGRFYAGDTVNGATLEGNRVTGIATVNHSDILFHADNYVVATGSFFSNGIVARSNEVVEPIFGADVNYDTNRDRWFDRCVMNRQPYMDFGVATDADFRMLKDGRPFDNMYAIGSVLDGHNPLEEGSGSGVAIITAMHVANSILTNTAKR